MHEQYMHGAKISAQNTIHMLYNTYSVHIHAHTHAHTHE